MNELTDEQIDALLVLHGKGDDGFHSFARGAIAADRALQASRVAELEAQLEAVGADCESWYKQNQQSIDDANKFGGERDSAWAEVERLKADALRAAVAPDSWVLVPLEPTAEMLQAGQDTPVSESDEDALEDYKAVYRAMLAAAPHPQQIAGLDKDAEIAALKAERDALKQDAERLDWLDQNIFSRENINFMGQLDPTMNMWVTFSPKGHQGSARNILDAAMQAQEVKS